MSEFPTSVEIEAFERSLSGHAPLAYADCQRCGAPAHPIRGYCGRFCEEAARCVDDAEMLRIARLGPVTPEETATAYAEAYAAIESDIRKPRREKRRKR